MKLAFPTDHAGRISRHFGRAPSFVVVTLDEAGAEVRRERREKPHHGRGPVGGRGHGDMFAPVSDCDAVVGGGMGAPAFRKGEAAGLAVKLVPERTIEAALAAHRAGTLAHDPRLVHHRHPHCR